MQHIGITVAQMTHSLFTHMDTIKQDLRNLVMQDKGKIKDMPKLEMSNIETHEQITVFAVEFASNEKHPYMTGFAYRINNVPVSGFDVEHMV